MLRLALAPVLACATESLLVIGLLLLVACASCISAVPLGGSCTSDAECVSSVPDSVCSNSTSVCINAPGSLGGSCFANSTCSSDTLQCANNYCIIKIGDIVTCSDNNPCADPAKECNPQGLCVTPGELGSECDNSLKLCSTGYSCTIGICVASASTAAKCDCTCNGGLVNTFGQLPAASCESCSNVCSTALHNFCTRSGLGFATDANRGTAGFWCKRAAASGGFEIVESNPDGTTTVVPYTEPSSSTAGVAQPLPAAASTNIGSSFSTLFVAMACAALVAALQL